jgi:hypothetical protein
VCYLDLFLSFFFLSFPLDLPAFFPFEALPPARHVCKHRLHRIAVKCVHLSLLMCSLLDNQRLFQLSLFDLHLRVQRAGISSLQMLCLRQYVNNTRVVVVSDHLTMHTSCIIHCRLVVWWKRVAVFLLLRVKRVRHVAGDAHDNNRRSCKNS